MGEITIEKPAFDGRRLISKVSTSDGLRKYLKNMELFIEYDTDIYANESILNIPLTATILPLAWLTGSDIHVSSLDKTFKESMDKQQKHFAKMFPKGLFTTEIKAKKLVDNKIEVEDPEKRMGMLFSGGVDSHYSLINNIQNNPRLVTMWGSDDFPYPQRSDHWKKAISIYQKYAKKKNLELHILKTNVSQILNFRRVEHKYHKELYDGRIRGALQHSLVLLPPSAPLSVGRFDKFIISATHALGHDYRLKPNSAGQTTDEMIIWADLSIKHDGPIDRYEKIKTIVDFHKDEPFTLRICSRSPYINGKINDCKCSKCLSTIVRLILTGFDPNKCGFDVDKSTFEFLKSMWENKEWAAARTAGSGWRDIQNLIPTQIDFDVNGSKEFFEWFKDFDLGIQEKNWLYNDLYMWLPFRLAKILDKVYHKYGIILHQYPYNREYAYSQKQSNTNTI